MLEHHQQTLSDVEFLSVVTLRRRPFDHEVWRDECLLAAKLALRSISDQLALTVPDDRLIDPANDAVVAPDQSVIDRAYRLALDRLPSADERASVCTDDGISLSRLSQRILSSDESHVADGLVEPGGLAAFKARRWIATLTRNFDLDAERSMHRGSAVERGARRWLTSTSPEMRVLIDLFPMNEQALRNVVDDVAATTGTTVTLVQTDRAAIIDQGSLDGADVFITNNNNLYDRTDEQLAAIDRSGAFSICWLWDNHHQFDFSARIASAFDMVVPAHSIQTTYLAGGRAIVGPVIPCCTFQWHPEEVERYFDQSHGVAPQDTLYGRFNSYPGRLGRRDIFLAMVAEQVSRDVVAIPYRANRWNAVAGHNRFLQIATHKPILCSPIFNDVPCRVFDALLCGSIAILPYGLPDTAAIFPEPDLERSGIVQYRDGDLGSLRQAVARANAVYDRSGADGRLARHRLITRSHLLQHRVSRILIEALTVRSMCGGESDCCA